MVKLKDIINEGFSVVGGVVSTPAIGGGTNTGLSDIVEDIYGTQEKVSAKEIKEAMGQFSSFGETFSNENNIKDVAEQLSQIAEKAKNYTLSETDDWFDKVTINRNMKELTNLSKSFGKIAKESNSLQQRLSGLYEDMGHVLGRYFEMEDGGIEGHNIKEGDYEEFFKSAMDKFGISSPDELDDEAKKKFFNYVDKNYKAKSEGRMTEGKWAVEVEGIGKVIVDAQSKGQAKTLVGRQLKKGMKAIIDVTRVQTGFATQMDKRFND